MKKQKFAEYIKTKRLEAGLSQKDVSDNFGYSTPQFISNWERGISAPPMKTLKKLAQLYKTPAEDMFHCLLEDTLHQVEVDFKRKMSKIL